MKRYLLFFLFLFAFLLFGCISYGEQPAQGQQPPAVHPGQPMRPTPSPSPSVAPNVHIPTVDLKVNNSNGPLNIQIGASVQLQWTTTGSPLQCIASGDWAGYQNVSVGAMQLPPLFGPRRFTYVLTCTNSLGSASDSVLVNVSGPQNVIAPQSQPPLVPSLRVLSPDLTQLRVGAINVSAVVDDSSDYSQPDSYFYNILQRANQSFTDLTGVSFNVINLVHMASNSYGGTGGLQAAYLARYPTPEYLLIFTRNDNTSASNGGYGGIGITGSSLPAGFTCNRLNSTNHGKRTILVGFANAMGKVWLCGYNSTRFIPGGWNTPATSSVSINGQCQNISGVACNFDGGASRCSDWRQREEVNSTASITELDEYFVLGTIIHELGHSFGTAGVYDHFGTTACISRTSSSINWSAVDIMPSLRNFHGLCPDIYTRIRNSYGSCP